MARRERRRLCKFISDWTTSDQFSSWLTPVKGQKHKAYCLLCKKVFAVSHGGLNDVKAHYKGKRHIWLQLQHQERVAGQSEEGHVESQTKRILFNEEADTLEEALFNPDTVSTEDETVGYDSSRHGDTEYWPLFETEVKTEDLSNQSAAREKMNTQQKMLPQQYCLRWKYHHNNLQVMFSQLLERESFCDVTLACEGKTLRAHKVVLSACSTYFDAIFSQYEEKNPIVILKDVKFTDIKALVEFMYKGEINIDHSHLASLLKTAEDLRIKGLAEVSWRQEGQPTQPSNEDSINCVDPQVSHVESVGNGSDLEPPLKRRRGRPPMESNVSSFSPKVTSVTGAGGTEEVFLEGGTVSSDVENEVSGWDESEPEVIACDTAEAASHQPAVNPLPSKYTGKPVPDGSTLRKSDLQSLYEEKLKHKETNYNETTECDLSGVPIFEGSASGMSQLVADKYRDVIKLNDYLTTGRRQQFWEEPFTRRIMEAIKSKELEMKAGAELLGVSYGTLYGRYRDAYGCLKHPYRVRDFWSESGPADVLAKVQRKEITLFRAAEMLNVTVTTLANYLSTLRRGGSSSGDEGVDESRDGDDSFEEMTVSLPMASTPKKLATAALENNPDITIVKQENTVPISNHEQDDDDDSAPSSVATNNNAENSDIEMGDGQETNGTHDDGK
ncbi:protein bric-a-brac 2-like isoform X2 [Periplaneta americana]|uniref:protein bric-a-brac 2-like isoform X2 n=1 Tax=Periplaneta americana TaxID=6978 RepID=UPI0037E97C7D